MQPSFNALALLYFGLHHDGSYNCASPVRKSLIRNWKNLLSSDCAAGDTTCSAGWTHAWRRGDLSGTTDASQEPAAAIRDDADLTRSRAASTSRRSMASVVSSAASQELTECFANNAIIGPAITSHGFVAVPGGVQCLDYPKESATTVAPLANTQGKGKVALPVITK